MPTIFLSPSSRFQEHTNPTILMDAKQLALTLSFFEPYVFTCNNHRHRAIFLVTPE